MLFICRSFKWLKSEYYYSYKFFPLWCRPSPIACMGGQAGAAAGPYFLQPSLCQEGSKLGGLGWPGGQLQQGARPRRPVGLPPQPQTWEEVRQPCLHAGGQSPSQPCPAQWGRAWEVVLPEMAKPTSFLNMLLFVIRSTNDSHPRQCWTVSIYSH